MKTQHRFGTASTTVSPVPLNRIAPAIITYTFPRCWVHIDESIPILHTAFDSGRKLEAVPFAKKDDETAKRYGYGDDIWRLWREHDVLHHTIGTLYGHGLSPTIWTVTHMDSPAAIPLWARKNEEAYIAHIHRWLNLDLWHEDLAGLDQFEIPRPILRDRLRAVLAGEILNGLEVMS